MDLDLHDGALAVCRLGPAAEVPGWAAGPARPLHAVTRTSDELSIITADARVPDGVAAERGWRALAVRGPLDFALTGVLAELARPLADAGVPIFVVSTYDTDWVLVPEHRAEDAVAALVAAGHHVHARPAGPPASG